MRLTVGAAILVVTVVLTTGCGQVITTPPVGGPGAGSSTPSGPVSTRVSAAPIPSPTTSPVPSSAEPGPTTRALQLPRGGREVFPRYRLVGYSGLTGARTLGRLGTGDLDDRLDEIERRARRYRDGRRILPVAEIIATVVHSSPGKDRKYRGRTSDQEITRYLRAVRKQRAVLLLNIQPGRADFLDEVKAHERWLREPDVGVALDPEWAMDARDVPGRGFGNTTGRELDEVARYLSGLVTRHRLPEKIMVVHELAPFIVRGESAWRRHPGVAAVKSVDGIGTRAAKEATYRRVWRGTPTFVRPGFKLFFEEDRDKGRLMTPNQVLALEPQPEYVLYE